MMTEKIQVIAAYSEVAALLSDLESGNIERACTAQEALNRIGPNAVGPLLALLSEERKRKNRNRPIVRVLFLVLGALYLLLCLYWASPIMWSLIPVQAVVMVWIARLLASSRLQNGATHALALLDDIHAIGPLAEALEFRDLYAYSGTASMAEKALTRLLPRLQTEDAAMLDEEQRSCLWRILANNPYPEHKDLTVAILRALERIGDDEALPTVQFLANLTPRNEIEREIHIAARECLPLLQARVAGRTDPHLLLRATTSDAGHALLRSAGGTDRSEADVLLRPQYEERG